MWQRKQREAVIRFMRRTKSEKSGLRMKSWQLLPAWQQLRSRAWIPNELVGKLGMKNLSKGVKVEVTEEHVSVNMALNLKYGYSIPDVCEKVQEKVKSAIENMTGLTVLDVNIKIAGVSMEEK